MCITIPPDEEVRIRELMTEYPVPWHVNPIHPSPGTTVYQIVCAQSSQIVTEFTSEHRQKAYDFVDKSQYLSGRPLMAKDDAP